VVLDPGLVDLQAFGGDSFAEAVRTECAEPNA